MIFNITIISFFFQLITDKLLPTNEEFELLGALYVLSLSLVSYISSKYTYPNSVILKRALLNAVIHFYAHKVVIEVWGKQTTRTSYTLHVYYINCSFLMYF